MEYYEKDEEFGSNLNWIVKMETISFSRILAKSKCRVGRRGLSEVVKDRYPEAYFAHKQ